MVIGGRKEARRAYGLDDLALAPGTVAVDPQDAEIGLKIGDIDFEIPFLAAAMDSAVDVSVAAEMSRLGGLAVINGEGLQTRYANPSDVIEEVINEPAESVIPLIQRIYTQPVQPELIAQRVKEIKEKNAVAAISLTPLGVHHAATAIEAGADIIVIQSSATTATFKSSRGSDFDLSKICAESKVPVLIGNCCTYEGTMSLMEAGAAGVLVGVGPGAACTTRRVLGLGVPQGTAIADAAAARADYFEKTGKHVAVIADGGMRNGGDICKAIACGADGVMMGQPISRSKGAPGRGYHWGMATSSAGLPRGTRIEVGQRSTLEQLFFGPATTDDGTLNLVGALKLGMGTCGVSTLEEMQQVEVLVAPALQNEGKRQQFEQRVGQGK